MSYKDLYIELANELSNRGVYICDDGYLGYAIYAQGLRAFIFVKASMSYKHKLFTLAHETGHLYSMEKGNMFVWHDKARSESLANAYAIQYLIRLGVSAKEYNAFYSKVSKVKIRKAWHLL